MPDSMHADTNQLQRDLEMMNALASSIDYFNGKQFSAVGSLSEQQGSAQRSFWNAFRDGRVRSQLGHVAERMENKLAAERASQLKLKVADAELKPTEYRFVPMSLYLPMSLLLYRPSVTACRLTGDQSIEVMKKYSIITRPLWEALDGALQEVRPATAAYGRYILSAIELTILYERSLSSWYCRYAAMGTNGLVDYLLIRNT